MKRNFIATVAAVCLSAGAGHTQTKNDAAVKACQSTGLIALKERSTAITDLVLDMETLAVSAADTKVENVAVKTVVMGDAYIATGGETGKPNRSFACLRRAKCY